MKGKPLPKNPYNPKSSQAWYDAYEACLWLQLEEKWAVFSEHLAKASSENVRMLQLSPRVAARTLGYALVYAPTAVARDCVARELIASDRDPEILAALAHLYVFGVIRVFRNPKGLTPNVSADQSPGASLEDAVTEHTSKLAPAGEYPLSFKQTLLAREHYRCAFTGTPDRESFHRRTSIPELKDLQPPIHLQTLEVSHIISQSLTEGVGGMTDAAQAKLNWASSAHAILNRFSGADIQNLLADLGVQNLTNAMMASSEPHRLFDRLALWLIPVQDEAHNVVPNTHSINYASPDDKDPTFRDQVTFDAYTKGGETIPPPSPFLLAFHATCAQVAHISGATEVLDDFFRDTNPLHAMSSGFTDMSVSPSAADELTRALDKVLIGVT